MFFKRNYNYTDIQENITKIISTTQDDEEQTENLSEAENTANPEISDVREKEIYKIIGLNKDNLPDYVSYDANPCADGGKLLHIDVHGYTGSTHEVSDDVYEYEIVGTVKTIYITGYDHYIINNLMTGKKYKYYAGKVDGISSLEYDYSLFSYACSFKETINSKPVTIWIFFNSTDGKSTGAVISTENLKGKYTGKCRSENDIFLLNQGGLPLNEMKNNYSELFENNLIHSGSYSNIGKNVNIFLALNCEDESQLKLNDYINDPISSFSLFFENNKIFKDIEILPGVKMGDSCDSIMSKGYAFWGEPVECYESLSDKMYNFTFRVGAVNYECFIPINDDKIFDNAYENADFIIKPLCNG